MCLPLEDLNCFKIVDPSDTISLVLLVLIIAFSPDFIDLENRKQVGNYTKVDNTIGDFMKKVLLATWALRDR